jgi:cell division protein ZapA
MPELIPVNIIIADRSYRLKIETSDEEMVRKTIKTLNEKIVEFKTNFAGKDMQDYVAMVLLWYATEQQKPTSAEIASVEDEDKLKRLEDILDKALQS